MTHSNMLNALIYADKLGELVNNPLIASLYCYCIVCLFHFRRAHTLTVLVVLVCVLIYVAVFEPVRDDTSYNTKR